MSYTLRDKNGIMRMKMPNRVANILINDVTGSFRSYRSTTMKNPVTAFEIAEGSKFLLGGLDIFLWEGDLLIPEV